MKYKVIDPKGIHFAGKKLNEGDSIETESTGADIKAFLHFRQIKTFAEEPESRKPSIEISEAAQKLATEHNIDVSTLKGTGAQGAIVKGDVEAAIAAAK